MRRNTDGTYTASPIQTIGVGGGITNFLNSVADFHTHPDDAAPSAKDIFRLDTLHDQIPGFKTSYTKGSSGSMYAITITDATKFSAFKAANPNSVAMDNGFNPTSDLGIAFLNAKAAFQSQPGITSLEAFERATAFVLKDSGVTLLKAPSGSNDFTKIGAEQKNNPDGTPAKDANGKNIYEKSDCPR